MRQTGKIWMVYILAFAIAGSVVGTVASPVQSEAAVVTRYYIDLDNNRFEVTEQEYDLIYSKQNDDQALYECLKSILGDRMPASFSVVSGRVETTDDRLPPTVGSTPSGTEKPAITQQDESSDFVIRGGVLVSYRGSAAVVRVPNTVKEVGSLAFYNNKKVKAVILPSSVKKAAKFAFARCSSLRYIVFPKETVSFGKYVIYQCDKLTNLVAQKGSKAYEYAVDNDLLVTTSGSTKPARSHCYLLPGDAQKNPLLNNLFSVKYVSSKKSVVSVSSTGTLKAKKKGTATITATAGEKKYTCKVTVYGKTVKNRVNQIVKSEIQKGMSKKDKVKAVHNWMIRNVKYDYERLLRGYIPHVSHTAKGALLKKIAVCDGYAHAFQMVMKKLNIPCRFVVGRSNNVGHAWNMVKLGGKWYHLDATFDDPIVNGSNTNTKPYYTYFLKSSTVMKKSHSWVVSKYPKCTSKKYDKG